MGELPSPHAIKEYLTPILLGLKELYKEPNLTEMRYLFNINI